MQKIEVGCYTRYILARYTVLRGCIHSNLGCSFTQNGLPIKANDVLKDCLHIRFGFPLTQDALPNNAHAVLEDCPCSRFGTPLTHNLSPITAYVMLEEFRNSGYGVPLSASQSPARSSPDDMSFDGGKRRAGRGSAYHSRSPGDRQFDEKFHFGGEYSERESATIRATVPSFCLSVHHPRGEGDTKSSG